MNMGRLGFLGAQEFSAGRQVEEKLAHLDNGAGGAAGGLDLEDFSAADDDLGPFRGSALTFASDEGEAADAGDAGQGLAAEAHGLDGGEVFGALNFTGGVALQREQGVITAHPEAVVNDAHQASAAGLNFDADARRVCVEGIFHQLLNDAGGAFDDFTRGDLIGDLLGQKTDAVHGASDLIRDAQCVARNASSLLPAPYMHLVSGSSAGFQPAVSP